MAVSDDGTHLTLAIADGDTEESSSSAVASRVDGGSMGMTNGKLAVCGSFKQP